MSGNEGEEGEDGERDGEVHGGEEMKGLAYKGETRGRGEGLASDEKHVT